MSPNKRRPTQSSAPSSDPQSRDVSIGDVDEDAQDAQDAPEEAEEPTPAPKTPAESAANTRLVTVPLPSRGRLYGGAIPNGEVRIRKILVAEEQILFSSGGDTLSKIARLLQACCALPKGFKHRDLLISDRFFILVALRTETYGPNYRISFRCDSCGSTNKKVIDIAQELNEKPAGEDLHEPWEVELPDAGVTVGMRFRRGHDEEESVRAAKIARQKGVEGTIEDQSFTLGLARRILTIDGVEVENVLEARRLINRMTAKDSAAIRIREDLLEPGIDTRIYPECTNCGAVNDQEMPFDLEFFRPTVL